MHQYIERVVDLTEPEANQIHNLTIEEARRLLLEVPADAMREIAGSFALLGEVGQDRQDGALARPADALFPRQAAGRAGADRRFAHRRDLQLAEERRPRWAVSSQLHQNGARSLCRRDSTYRLPRSRSGLYALLHSGTRHAAARSRSDWRRLYRRAGGRDLAVARPRSCR